MAQLAMGVAGAAIGSMFGVPQIGFAVGSLLGAFLFPAKGPTLNDNKTVSSAYGQPIPRLYGTSRMAGQLIWAAKSHQRDGGKGSLLSGAQIETQSVAFAFCKGPVSQLIRYWFDGTLIFDATGQNKTPKSHITSRFYYGDENQQPDSEIAFWVANNISDTPNATPAYRGLCYIVFQDLRLSDYGNRIPNITAEIAVSGTGLVPGSTYQQLTTTTDGPFTTIGQGVVDWLRGTAYSFDANQGIRTFNLAAQREMSQHTEVDLGLTPPPTYGTIQALAAVQGGSLYLATFENKAPIYRIDPDSMRCTGVFGYPGSIGGLSPNSMAGFRTAQQIIPVTVESNTYLVVLSQIGQVGVLDGTFMSYVYGDPNTIGYVPIMYQSILTELHGCSAIPGLGVTKCYFIVSEATSGNNPFGLYCMHVGMGAQYDARSNETIGLTVELIATIYPTDLGLSASSLIAAGPMCYDITDATLIISAGGCIFKFDPSGVTPHIVWVTHGCSFPGNEISYSILRAGTLVANNQGDWAVIDTRDGSIKSHGSSTTDAMRYRATDGYFYNSDYNGVVQFNSNKAEVQQVLFGRASSNYVYLSDVIIDVCGACDIPQTMVDVSKITQKVHGYAIARNTSGKDVLAQLSQAFFFDVTESDYTLKFVPKGTLPATTLVQTDLGTPSNTQDGNYWQHLRAQTHEMPVQVDIHYQDKDLSYETGYAYEKRVSNPVKTVYGKQKLSVELPISMDVTAAKTIAATWLYTIWQERDSYKCALGPQYMWLDPADAVTVNLDNGDTYTVRITSMTLGADYKMMVDFIGEDQQTYSQSFTNFITPDNPYAQVVTNNSPARLWMLNTPLLLDSQDTGGTSSRIYYGSGAYQSNSSTQLLYHSADGSTYTIMDTIGTSLTWGTCLKALPPPALVYGTDTVNTLTISLVAQSDVLASISTIDFLNGGNAALIGGTEIIQFQNVTMNGDGSITLSNLLRGRRGTEWAVGSHIPGEPFILLSAQDVRTRTIPLGQVRVAQNYKLVPSGTYPDEIQPVSQTFLGYDLKPYAPTAHKRQVSGSDLLVSWTRRTRYGGDLRDGGGEVPLGEQSELYNAYVLAAAFNASTFDPTNATTYKRAFTGLTAAQFLYTAAQMATDGFVPASQTLHVVVFQMSAAIGAGWPGAADLAPF